MVTLYVCSRLCLPFGPGLLAATIGLAEIGALTYLSVWVLRKWGVAGIVNRRQLEASLLTTFTIAMLGFGGLTALAP